jgi:hypothetical protein
MLLRTALLSGGAKAPVRTTVCPRQPVVRIKAIISRIGRRATRRRFQWAGCEPTRRRRGLGGIVDPRPSLREFPVLAWIPCEQRK